MAEVSMGELAAKVSAVIGVLASMPEAARIDRQVAIRAADAAFGQRISGEASRQISAVIDEIMTKAKATHR